MGDALPKNTVDLKHAVKDGDPNLEEEVEEAKPPKSAPKRSVPVKKNRAKSGCDQWEP